MARGQPETIILGCGNILLGDDGFGPAVIEKLIEKQKLPQNTVAMDVGTGIREYLLDYLFLPGSAPDMLIIVDAVNFEGCSPGDVFLISPATIPTEKVHDFSLHQFPTVNLLKELELNSNTTIFVVAAQTEHLPKEVCQGLSPVMTSAVPTACQKVLQIISHQKGMSTPYEKLRIQGQ